MIDIHCHLLPGIDDGPKNWDETLALCRAMAADGIKQATTTPHLIDGVYENDLDVVAPLVEELNRRLSLEAIELRVAPGAEIDISSRFVVTDEATTPTLNGHAILLEMPVAVVPAAMERLIFAARSRGLLPVLAHPERNHVLQGDPALAEAWIHYGAVLQIDAESLLGLWGRGACDCSIRLLKRGLVAAMASDAHSVDKRPPRMSEAIARARELFGESSEYLVQEGPEAILAGRSPEIPAMRLRAAPRKESWISRLLRRRS